MESALSLFLILFSLHYIDPTPALHRPYIDPTLSFFLHSCLNSKVIPPPPPHFYCFPPPPPLHFYCFPSSSSSSSLFIVFPSPPPHFNCFPSPSSFLLFSQTGYLEGKTGQKGQAQPKKAKIRPK